MYQRCSPSLPHSVALVAGAMILAACGPVHLDLRGLSGSGEGAPATATYVVMPGDTLGGIAQAYGARVEELIALNARDYPRLAESQGRVIVPGWRLKVPVAPASTTQRLAVAAPQAIVSTPQVAPAAGYFDDEAALEIVRLTNEERARNGLLALDMDERLTDIARRRAVEIVSNFGHDGISVYCNCGENIHAHNLHYPAQKFVVDWIASASHHETMLSDYHTTGVGVYRLETTGAAYAVQDFGR